MSSPHRKTDRRFPPHPKRKLTPEQAVAIRESTEPGPMLAKRYGVSNVTIWNVRWRVTYRELVGGRDYRPRAFAPQLAETPHYE